MDDGDLRDHLDELWTLVRKESEVHRKGALLEELVAVLLRSIAGFERVALNRRNRVEEIDAVVRNQSRDPFWQ